MRGASQNSDKIFSFQTFVIEQKKDKQHSQQWYRIEHLIYTDFLAHNHVDIRKISCL